MVTSGQMEIDYCVQGILLNRGATHLNCLVQNLDIVQKKFDPNTIAQTSTQNLSSSRRCPGKLSE